MRLTRELRIYLNALVRTIVLDRDGHHCQRGIEDPRGCGGVLQAAHLYSRGAYPPLAFDPANVVCLCWRHHLGAGGWHSGAVWCWPWAERHLGAAKLNLLYTRARFSEARRDLAAIKLALEREARARSLPLPVLKVARPRKKRRHA